MPPKKKIELPLTAPGDLFTTQAERNEALYEKIVPEPIDEIQDMPGHPFHVKIDDDFMKLVESIKKFGVLTPGVLRINENGQKVAVSGHRRKLAAKMAGLTEIPCVTRQMTHDEAIIYMVDSNLQREKILPSEKAFSYQMKLEAMKRQGQRTDLTSRPMVGKSEISDTIGELSGESGRQVQRYIRLTELIPELIQMVDDGKIAFRPAVEISYLTEKEQKDLLETIQSEECTPSLSQAERMKKFSQQGKLSMDVILGILSEEKPNQQEQVKIPAKRLSKYFPSGTPVKQMEDTIEKALAFYRQHQKTQQKNRGSER